ncbi:hypothetical protein FRC12_001144 [Ceratobasidium sp. 428]|nr:hypothetical protein FRC12_001144 [Ceratobasidium sp. 428]
MLDTISSRVFHTPELLGIICDHCTSEILSSVIPTSEYSFKVAAPRIWNDLKSVQPLLSLLSPTVALKADQNFYIDVALPIYSPEAFARFDLYSPLVRSLNISAPWETGGLKILLFWVSSWECFRHRGNPLPNLHTFVLSKTYRSDEEVLLWLSIFVWPGLQNLTIFSTYGLIQSSVIIALDLLQDKCPGLKRLVIPSDLPVSQTTQMVNSSVAIQHLRGLRSLTHLQVHGCFIDSESLVVASSLPKLQSFTIINNLPYYSNVVEVLRSTQLPDNSFPALISFNVTSHWLDVLMYDFQDAPPTEQRTFVRASYISYLPGHTVPAPREPALSFLVFVTTKFRPQLWPMHLGQMPLDWEQPPRIISEDPNWEYLRRFQLMRIEILNSSSDPQFMQASFPPLPTLEFLDMPDQFLTLSQLAYISQQMPLLYTLRSNLADVLDEVPRTRQPSTALLKKFKLVQPLKNRLEIRFPVQVARFLISIWPRLQRLEYNNEFGEGQPRLELLNVRLRATPRVVIKTKKNISGRF